LRWSFSFPMSKPFPLAALWEFMKEKDAKRSACPLRSCGTFDGHVRHICGNL
jgi:hypothetical protein